nr:MAG TPA: helix-turn-helix domain protein [Caudoviricetes sp.]
MSTINERIGEVVARSGLSKTAFAQKIKVSQQYVSKLVSTGVPSDRTIADICREFGVNELWLRHGDEGGPMFAPRSRREEISAYMGQLLGGQRTELEETIIEFMGKTDVKYWYMLLDIMRPLAEDIASIDKPPARTEETKPPDA